MSTTRTVAIAAMMIAFLPVTAYAEEEHQKPTLRSDEQKKEDAAIEKAYEQVMKGVNARTAPTKYDPWQMVRPAANDSSKK
jgi:hypothetical protein